MVSPFLISCSPLPCSVTALELSALSLPHLSTLARCPPQSVGPRSPSLRLVPYSPRLLQTFLNLVLSSTKASPRLPLMANHATKAALLFVTLGSLPVVLTEP
ncbi:hypothetical protein GOP47_0019198 [Adiantum capillus-veneris]|uniref:Uncharacterized protein n=1 Tax=Adiantum capillus-veneris TaxID=13818 RepID=A0A9D4UEP0_ADICA|nr:hypothetical protein GOP47_0019198 [Adiantum capillus-veneris]